MVGIWINTSDLILTRRTVRVAALLGSLVVGAGYMVVARELLDFPSAVFMLSIGLVAPLGVAKTATACGLNVVADLAPAGRPAITRLSGAAAYAVTATSAAAALGLAISLVGSWTGAAALLPFAGIVLLSLGLLELGVIGHGRALTLPWQVPAEWVRRRRFAPIVWGLLLGTGLTTYMPHPAYFGVLLMALMLPFPAGVALMAIYGVSRAVPTLLTAIQRSDGLLTRLHQDAWQLRVFGHAISGCASLALAAAIWVGLLRL